MKMNKLVALGLVLVIVGIVAPFVGVALPSPIPENVLQFAIVGQQRFDFVTSFSRADSVLIPEHGCWLTFDTRIYQVNPATDDVVHVLVRDANYQNVAGTILNVYVAGTEELVDSAVTDANGQVGFILGTGGDNGGDEPPQTMTFTSTAQGHGSISPSGTATHTVGEMITFTATPEAGYVVDFWTIDGRVHPDCGARTSVTVQMVSIYNGKTLAVHFRPQDQPPTPPPFDWMRIFNYVTIAGICLTGGGYALDKRKK